MLDGTWEAARRMYGRNPCLQALPAVCLPLSPPSSSSSSYSSSSSKEEKEKERKDREWLTRPPLFTIRKEPPDALLKGGRSTAEAVALALYLLGEEAVGGWVVEGVKRSNAMQVALMDPSKVRHRRERKGYVPNLYGGGEEEEEEEKGSVPVLYREEEEEEEEGGVT